ncbi:hypothetical protein [Methylotuvimicrobium sp. KM1]|uniref:hypothetical protein n=1 Tax=Methylotuvimicrobium sp. KM1 TaxID=3377707 RepID=UPI00384D40ED
MATFADLMSLLIVFFAPCQAELGKARKDSPKWEQRRRRDYRSHGHSAAMVVIEAPSRQLSPFTIPNHSDWRDRQVGGPVANGTGVAPPRSADR